MGCVYAFKAGQLRQYVGVSDRVAGNGVGLADVPALPFRQLGKLNDVH